MASPFAQRVGKRIPQFAFARSRVNRFIILTAIGSLMSSATVVPRLSLEEMVTRSEAIVVGSVIRSWTAWDGRHQFLWTHTEIAVRDTVKGSRVEKIVVSEPGGELDGVGMRIAGAPVYVSGEQVILFLERMPNGFLRSAGFGQGKLTVSPQGRVRVTHGGAELVRTRLDERGAPVESLAGAPASEVRLRVLRLVASRRGHQ